MCNSYVQWLRHERGPAVRAADVLGRELRVGGAALAVRRAARAGGAVRPVDRHGAHCGSRGARALRRRRAALAAHVRHPRGLQRHPAHLVLRLVREVR